MFSKAEEQRYSRHIKLDGFGAEAQEKLKNASVLCIGAGGLGATVLQYLASAGVGKITVIDGDVVEDSNLQRQVIFSTDDIGMSKAVAAKMNLLKLNPYIEVESIEEYFTTDNALELCEEHDVVVDGSDNFQTRYLVNDACVITDTPFVYGAVFKYDGQVSVFNYKGSATYRCLYPAPPSAGEMPACGEIGVLGVLPGLVGCYQANEVIKLLTGLGKPLLGKLLILNMLTLEHFTFEYTKDESVVVYDLLDDYDVFCGLDFSNVNEVLLDDINISEYVLIDVREPQEFVQGHLEGAVLIPSTLIQYKYQEVPKDKKVLLYCKSGARSASVVKYLQEEHQYTNVFSLKGGLKA